MILPPYLNFFIIMLSIHPTQYEFILADKQARICLCTLQQPKEQGGLAVPDSKLYFLAFQIWSIHIWMDQGSQISGQSIEARLTYSYKLANIPYIHIGWINTMRYPESLSLWWKDTGWPIQNLFCPHLYGTTFVRWSFLSFFHMVI